MKTIDQDYPTLSQAEIKEHGDMYMINAIGFAIAHSGLEKTNELARMLGVPQDEENVLKTVNNIIQAWECMDMELDLTRDRVFTVKVQVYQHNPHIGGSVTVQ